MTITPVLVGPNLGAEGDGWRGERVHVECRGGKQQEGVRRLRSLAPTTMLIKDLDFWHMLEAHGLSSFASIMAQKDSVQACATCA